MPRPTFRERGYSARWDRLRKQFLRAHPLCAMCERDGRVKAATCVDHIKPHRGDHDLMWDQANWESLCTHCHASTKQRMERGRIQAIGEDGWPLDG